MFNRLQLMEKRYNEINQLLTQPEIISNIKEMTSLLKEQKGLEEPVLLYQKYLEKKQELKSLALSPRQ